MPDPAVSADAASDETPDAAATRRHIVQRGVQGDARSQQCAPRTAVERGAESR
jgi:hypothetical protein